MNITRLLNLLKKKYICLWNENEKLKMFLPKGTSLEEKYRNYIITNKIEILKILSYNGITAKKDFLNKSIYRIESEYYPLSYAQERLFFIDEYEDGTNVYNIPMALKLNSQIDLSKLKSALNKIIEKHDILRTVIEEDNDRYIQVVRDSTVDILELDVKKKSIPEVIKSCIKTLFRLKEELPIKIWIINNTILIINIHHIAFDGWSTDIFLNELEKFYTEAQVETQYLSSKARRATEDFASKKDKENTELSTQNSEDKDNVETQYFASKKDIEPEIQSLPCVQYRNFAVWQKEYLQGEILEEQVDFWKNSLKGYENINLPLDKQRPSKLTYAGDNLIFTITKELSEKAEKTAKEKGITLYTLLLTCYTLLLSKYCNQTDIVVGSPIANRHYTETENVIGLFVNTLVLRTKINDDENIDELINKTSKHLIDAQHHQDLPFEKIVEVLNVEKDLSRSPIFQVMFGVQKFGKNTNKLFAPYPIENIYKISKFDLSLFVDDSKDKLSCNIEYATSLFNKDTIIRMSKHFERVIEQVVNNLNIRVKDISLLSKEEYQTIVYDWNKTETPYPKDKTVHALFEEQVEKTPDNIAVVFEDSKLSYRELNNRANQLAHVIRKEYKNHCDHEIKGDTLIGIYIDRSLEMIIAILGILKAGGAYVPFDRADPEERLKFKVNDCDCKMILTSSSMVEDLVFLTEMDTLPVSIDSYWSNISKAKNTNPPNINTSTDLAYVIYTSGSTGNPKGTMIEHTPLINRLLWMKKEYNFNKKDNVLQKTPYSFDVSVWELTLPFLCGSTLIFAKPEGHKDPKYLTKLIAKEKITKLHFVPSMLNAFTDYLSISNNFYLKTITDVICSGEALHSDLSAKTVNLLPHIKLHNLYGPTEATIDVSYHEFNKNNDINLTVPIGKPIQNYKLYLLDENLHPIPLGISGELYIGGKGLARGYLKRPVLTSNKFIDNPFQPNTKMYKTGDLCRWLPDGNIEYIGRNDFQIKINGLRIELGEIEAKLSEYSEVKQCAVTVYKQPTTNNKNLVAYYVLKQTIDHRLETEDQKPEIGDLGSVVRDPRSEVQDLESEKVETQNFASKFLEEQPTSNSQHACEEELRKYLSEKLPDYMVPNIFVKLDNMPLNTSGKIDRKVLPKPNFESSDDNYTPPKTEIEKQLVKIWQQLLSINKIGINDNFFKLGGNSILAIKLIHLVNKNTILNIKLSDLFEYKTIQNICSNKVNTTQIAIDEGEI